MEVVKNQFGEEDVVHLMAYLYTIVTKVSNSTSGQTPARRRSASSLQTVFFGINSQNLFDRAFVSGSQASLKASFTTRLDADACRFTLQWYFYR